MKQVSYHPRSGAVHVEDVPEPETRAGWVLVRNRYSLISAGTERGKIELGSKSLLGKARARPDLVRKVVDRARVEGPRAALSVARDRLDALAPLGYSSAGVVIAVGESVEGLAPGDRVACGGGGWANHAEVVAVPKHLVARVPEGVQLDAAAYATLGAVAMHGVRQSGAQLGERVGVIGLGLVGQLAARILAAAGCSVVGVDLDPIAVELAARTCAQAFERGDPALDSAVSAATAGIGLDAVLVCAAGASSDALELAARLARERGRLVVVGDVPVVASRGILYDKELELRLSRSYGPGRYDTEYEERGRDLPAGYVRWTEQRNLQAFIELLATARLSVEELTTHRFEVDEAAAAYAVLRGDGGSERAFGVLLEYPDRDEHERERPRPRRVEPAPPGARIGVIGAGAFARATIIPALAAAGANLVAVASRQGLSAADAASRYGFERAATVDELLTDESISGVVVATRHASHAKLAVAALQAGKHVFVEKPLALRAEELAEVEAALFEGAILMVGFNRRYAPLVERLRAELAGAPDRVVAARVNAGSLPSDHWLHEPADGGGRLIGEGCHFVDLLAHLGDAPAVSVHAVAVPQPRPLETSDCLAATVQLANGTVASLVYAGSGDSRMPKERIEAFGGGLAAALDDFRRLELYRDGRRTEVKGRQDKGHRAQFAAFVAALAGRAEPPAADSYLASSRATLALAESLRTGLPVAVPRSSL